MKSTVSLFGQVIDCRTIAFEGTFFHFSKEMGVQLAETFYSFVQSLFGSFCILDWRLNDRVIKDADQFNKDPHTIYDRYNNLGIELKGDIKSERVYNKSTLFNYSKDILYQLPLYKTIPAFCSADYPQYAEKEIDPFSTSPEKLREAILKTFSLEGRINKAIYEHHDIEGRFYISPDYVKQEQYTGDLCLRVSLYSIQDEIASFSEKLRQYVAQITTRFNDVNAVVRVRQSHERGYHSYFIGLKTPQDIRRDSNMDRNAYHRYLSDIGWATFISPYTAKLVDISPIDNGNTYTTKVMENGGLYIQNNESIEETTIHHLLGIKKQVYNAIYPGEGVFSLSFHNWRSHWENIPVFDDEVQIQNNNVVFSSKNIANTGFVLG